MTRASLSALLCTFLIFSIDRASSQTPVNPDSSLQELLRSMKGEPLMLRQAVDYALKNSTTVLKSEAALLATTGTVKRESGTFDPEFFFNLNYLDQEVPSASFFAGASVLSTQNTTSRTGLRMTLPIGTELQLAVNTNKLQTNSSFAFLNPEYDAFGSFTLRQPLLTGFAASTRKELTRAEREHDAQKARYDQQVLAVESSTEGLYWDLYASERDYAVQKLTRDRALAFLKETEVRAQTGLVGPNQVANARSFLAQMEVSLIEREESFDKQSDLLASAIGVRPAGDAGRFLPTDEPPADYAADSVDVLVEYAVKNNLDLIAADQDVRAVEALANGAGWEALPSVNLVGSLGGTGLTGTPQDVIFGGDTLRTTREGAFGDALTQVGHRDFPNWSVGVEVSIPIGLRSGLGEKERLEALVLAARQRYIEQARSLEEQVRSSHRELTHGKARLAAAKDGVDAAVEQLRIGIIEFRNGRSTAFELVRLGEDFGIAQQRYSGALVKTAKAAAELRQLTSGGYTGTSTR